MAGEAVRQSPEILLTAEARRRRDSETKNLFSASQRLGGKDSNFAHLLAPWAAVFRPLRGLATCIPDEDGSETLALDF
jgi:hypothetical protein